MSDLKKQKNITYFAKTNFRDQRKTFGIYQADRLLHTYIIGKTGVGKTTLLKTKLLQDIYYKKGCCLFDPHGDFVESVIDEIPESRRQDVIYLNIPDNDLDLGYNPIEKVPYHRRSLVASGLIEIFRKLWGDKAWGPKVENILRYVLLTLLDQEHATLRDIIVILHNENYRYECIRNVIDKDVNAFWQKEFKQYSKNDFVPVYNKIGAFLSHPALKQFTVENEDQINISDIMNQEKILLINCSKGKLGIDGSNVIGSMLLNAITSAAFSRITIKEKYRLPFYVYLDEFQNYTTETITNMLSELRKFRVGLIMAHQYIAQLNLSIRDAVLGNVGTIICMRISLDDAKYMERQFHPIFQATDFINLGNYEMYLKLCIYGKPSKAFSAKSIQWKIPER